MAKIHKLSKNGQTIYPATTTDAVVHPTLKVSASKLIGEINVSNLFPTGGSNGTNKYTLESAITKIPTDLRIVGIKCSFLDDAGDTESWEYKGGTFTNTASWRECGGRKLTELEGKLGNKILEWDTDVATTRKQVPSSERKKGLQISYKLNGENWIIEQFIGEYTVDAYWSNSSYWNTIATASDISASEVTLKKLFGRILEWDTTQANTLNSIPADERVAGLIVTFRDPSSGWKRLQYIADTVYTNPLWGNYPSNWNNLDLSEDITYLNDKIKELNDNKITKQVGKNLADPSEFQVGAYSSTGFYVDNANFMLTGYIPVKSQNLICNKAVTSSVYGAVFDSNKTWIRNLTNLYTYAEGDYYVRFCFKTLDKDSIQVEVGTESSDFENYTPLNIIKKLEDNIASLEADIAEIGNSQQLSDIKTGLASFGDVIEPFEIKENQYYDGAPV